MRTWIKPSAIEEYFASNQNIANSVNACYSLYCKVARDGKSTYYKDTTFKGKKFNWATIEVTPDKLLHDRPCACGLSYDQKKLKNSMKLVNKYLPQTLKFLKYMSKVCKAMKLHGNLQTAILINTMVMLLMTSQINQIILNTEHPFCVFLYLKRWSPIIK